MPVAAPETAPAAALRVARAGPVLTLTFDRPGKRNSVRRETVEAILAALDEADVRVIVFAGANGDFTAGQDLDEVEELLAEDAALGRAAGIGSTASVEGMQEVTRRLLEHPAVVICALQGVAVGFGAEMALSADIRIASPSLRMGFPEARRAMVQTNGVTWLLPRIVGIGRAAELLLTGRLIGSAEAQAIGLVTGVHDDVDAAARELAATIGANAPLSLGHIKRLLRAGGESGLAAAMDSETAGMLAAAASEDFVEGTRAFHERRAPHYVGR